MSMFRQIALILIGCLLCVQVFQSHSGAASRLTENFSDLMRVATAVVEVEIIKLEPIPEGSGMPMTLATLTVRKVHKGEVKEATITAEHIGGVHDNQRVIATGHPEFAVGDRAVLLLKKANDAATNWRIVGGDAGHVILVNQLGRTIARRATGTFDFFVPDAQSITGYTEVKAPVVTMERLNELVHALVSTGRPVLENSTAQSVAPVKLNQRDTTVALAPISSSSGSSLAERLAMIFVITTGGWLLLRVLSLRAAK